MAFDNEKRILTLHPYVADKARALIKLAAEKGHKIIITNGTRTNEEQQKLYDQGRVTPGKIVTNAKPGSSYHNFKLAFDFAIVKDDRPTWDAKVDVDQDGVSDYVEVGELGESLGLEWGGRWRFLDLPHFQFTFGLTLAQLRAGVKPPESVVE